eukprot:TRINITY_DN25041_c0_g1_i1.p1 TRINITY_DN25041_c0_g1~~TRINITY_DN25041_c0_g1_i1.p1  ORF type:complete len:295 (-),score=58.62 TRINITY_DN25041_c0_g1_i1:27-911(-)
MPQKGDRIGMSLDEVIKKDWSSGAKGDRTPKGRGKAGRKGRGAGVRQQNNQTRRQASDRRGSNARLPQSKLRNLWRGARAPRSNSQASGIKAWVMRRPLGSIARGKGRVAPPQRNLKKVNRAGGIQKRGRMLGNFFKGTARRKGAGKGPFGKRSGKNSGAQAIADADYGKGYSKNGSAKGFSKGKGNKRSGFKGAGSWDEDFDRYDRWADGNSFGKSGKSGKGYSGGGGYVEEQKATDQLTAEDKRMMKKITIVAQLDKVPKPHPAMQGLASGKNSRRRSEGSLSSRFAANYTR